MIAKTKRVVVEPDVDVDIPDGCSVNARFIITDGKLMKEVCWIVLEPSFSVPNEQKEQ